ncbi:MAG: hypothetical protein JG777_367 [Clostridia bacterium]|jgi:hypothetical protein|nr:hypothetical protein [Clostridia bacterium]
MTKRGISIIMVTAMIINLLVCVPFTGVSAEEVLPEEVQATVTSEVYDDTKDMVLWYKFDEVSGTTAADSSGKGHNGTLYGGVAWSAGKDGNAILFNGTDSYINMGTSKDLQPSDITVSFWYKRTAATLPGEIMFVWAKPNGAWNGEGWYFTSSWEGALTFCTDGAVITSTNEKMDTFFPKDEWIHIAATLDSQTKQVKLYKNGVAQPTNQPSGRTGIHTITATSDTKYMADNSPAYSGGYASGCMDDFRIYSRALSADEIQGLAQITDEEVVRIDKEALTLGDTSAVVSNLTLPTKGANGSTIIWTSSHKDVVADDGTVTRPAYGKGNTTVTLTATITKGDASLTKQFTVVVLEDTDLSQAVAADKAALNLGEINAVRGNLTLPSVGANGTTITWKSDNEAVIAVDGKVTRPANGSGNVTVKLTATITKGTVSDTKEFIVTVIEEGASVQVYKPFKLSQVRLLDGYMKELMQTNANYLYELDSDRLLHMFRVTAGLPSTAQPLGGWEQPTMEIRGHTMGHYLSACAMLYASTGDEQIKAKADAIIAELAKCQQALGGKYLSAYPETLFERLEAGQGAWVPWYSMHKIFAGLYDMYIYAGNEQAFEMLKNLADWAKGRIDKLSDADMARILKVEFGGMNEVLYNLYEITGNMDHLNLAHRFDQKEIFDPLARGEDKLSGLHANTQIPKIIGAARRYELVEEEEYKDIAENFWDIVVNTRTFATGGNSTNEHFGDANQLSGTLNNVNHETCNTYNMLKLTRHLFEWTGSVEYADYYERAFINGILSTMHPETGMKMYFVPMGTGYFKVFHTKNDSFYCCTGTGMESFAKLGDSIYFHRDNELYVNLFIASMLDWNEKGVKIEQRTNYPEEQGTKLIVHAQTPATLGLNIRVPYWATSGVTVKINGVEQQVEALPSSYLKLEREWKDGDTIEISMPMSLHTSSLPDDEKHLAVMYGPVVLCGLMGTDNIKTSTVGVGVLVPNIGSNAKNFLIVPEEKQQDVSQWFEPVEGEAMTFKTVEEVGDITFKPFYKVFDERYGIYWKVTDEIPFSPPSLKPTLWYKFDETSGTTVTDYSGNGYNGTLMGGATFTSSGKDGGAVDLNGTDGYVDLPDGITNNFDKITVSAWVKIDTNKQWARIFDFGTGFNASYMFLTPYAGGSTFRFAITTGGAGGEQIVQRTSVLGTGSWKHMVVVLDGATASIYENGVKVATSSTVTTFPWQLGELTNNYIGKSQYNDPYLDGQVDDFRIYNRALSDAEVQALYTFQEPEITSFKPVEIKTIAGTSVPVLPGKVTAIYNTGLTWEVDVEWDEVDPSRYAQPGTFKVEGTVQGTNVKAIANITVEGESQNNKFDINTTFNLNALAPKKILNASVQVKNNDSQEGAVMAIVALYDGNDKMVNVSYISKEIPIGVTEELCAGFRLPANVDGYKVKVFVWDGTSLDTTAMQPLSNVVELQ